MVGLRSGKRCYRGNSRTPTMTLSTSRATDLPGSLTVLAAQRELARIVLALARQMPCKPTLCQLCDLLECPTFLE